MERTFFFQKFITKSSHSDFMLFITSTGACRRESARLCGFRDKEEKGQGDGKKKKEVRRGRAGALRDACGRNGGAVFYDGVSGGAGTYVP